MQIFHVGKFGFKYPFTFAVCFIGNFKFNHAKLMNLNSTTAQPKNVRNRSAVANTIVQVGEKVSQLHRPIHHFNPSEPEALSMSSKSTLLINHHFNSKSERNTLSESAKLQKDITLTSKNCNPISS